VVDSNARNGDTKRLLYSLLHLRRRLTYRPRIQEKRKAGIRVGPENTIGYSPERGCAGLLPPSQHVVAKKKRANREKALPSRARSVYKQASLNGSPTVKISPVTSERASLFRGAANLPFCIPNYGPSCGEPIPISNSRQARRN
jgi:hypothetical protein